jgi:hypothetical protein
MAVPKHVLGALSLLLLVVVALVALSGDSSSHSTSDKPTVTHLTSAPSTTHLASDPTACASPTWDAAVELPSVDAPADSPCERGLWADNADGSLRSFKIDLTPENKAYLDAKPQREEYVPCNFTIDGGSADSIVVHDAECRYKGSVGSFSVGTCVSATDGHLMATSPDRQCKLSWKIKLKHGTVNGGRFKDFTKTNTLLDGTNMLQFSGMTGDASLMRTPIGYDMLNDAGFVSPCSKPSHIYVNGGYQGIYANTENPDDIMMKRRVKLGILTGDALKGKGTFYKELWPIATDESYYVPGSDDNFTAVPSTSNPKVKVNDGALHSDLFYGLAREAKDCVDKGDDYCTKDKASEILGKYINKQSFVNGFVGLALAGNWDSIFYDNHNYMLYVTNSAEGDDAARLYYSAWDLDQTFRTPIWWPMSMTQGATVSFPWFHYNMTAFERKYFCDIYKVPTSSPWPSFQTYGMFACNPANNLMARALKDDFFTTWNDVYNRTYTLANQRMQRWQVQMESGVKCANQNGYYPSWDQEQAEMGKGPTPAPVTIPTMQSLYKQVWTSVANGDDDAFPRSYWPNGFADLQILSQYGLDKPAYNDGAFCFRNYNDWMAGGFSGYTGMIPGWSPGWEWMITAPQVDAVMSDACLDSSSSRRLLGGKDKEEKSAECVRRCAKFFQTCFNGVDDCSWLGKYTEKFKN